MILINLRPFTSIFLFDTLLLTSKLMFLLNYLIIKLFLKQSLVIFCCLICNQVLFIHLLNTLQCLFHFFFSCSRHFFHSVRAVKLIYIYILTRLESKSLFCQCSIVDRTFLFYFLFLLIILSSLLFGMYKFIQKMDHY